MAKRRKEEISDSERSDTENYTTAGHSKSDSEHSAEEQVNLAPKKSPKRSPHSKQENAATPSNNSDFESLSSIEKFLHLNPDLVKVKCGFKLSKDDEVSILQIPRSINHEELMGITVNFEKKTKLKLNGVKYVIRPKPVELEPILIIGKKPRLIQPVSSLHLQKHIKNKEIGDLQSLQESKISLPDNIKVRHPLFGVDYKQKIVLDEETEKKLNEPIKAAPKAKKAKKKPAEDDSSQSILNLFTSSQSPKKKSKKAKSIANSTVHPDSQLTDFDLDFSRIEDNARTDYETEKATVKKKKKKKEPGSVLKPLKQEAEEALVTDFDAATESTVIKRKKKKKRGLTEESISKEEPLESFKSDYETDPETSAPKRKKKREASVKSDYETEPESPSTKKKKKKKQNPEPEYSDMTETVEPALYKSQSDEYDNETSFAKTKLKKKTKAETLPNYEKAKPIKTESFRSDYETENESTAVKKKRRKSIATDVNEEIHNAVLARLSQTSEGDQPKKKKPHSDSYAKLKPSTSQINGDFQQEPAKRKKIKKEAVQQSPVPPVDLSIVKMESGKKKSKVKTEPPSFDHPQNYVTPKKKSAKAEKPDDEGNRLINDILNSVKSKLESSGHKKKKH